MDQFKQLFLTWQFWAGLSALAAACTAIFAKLGVKGVDPDVATFVRTIVILLFVFLILIATGELASVAKLSRRTIGFLVLSGLATGVSWICYFRALNLGKASLVASVDKLSVVLVAVIAFVFLQETLGWREIGGLMLITIGAILVARG